MKNAIKIMFKSIGVTKVIRDCGADAAKKLDDAVREYLSDMNTPAPASGFGSAFVAVAGFNDSQQWRLVKERNAAAVQAQYRMLHSKKLADAVCRAYRAFLATAKKAKHSVIFGNVPAPVCDTHRHYDSDYAFAIADAWSCIRRWAFKAPFDGNVVGAAIEYIASFDKE